MMVDIGQEALHMDEVAAADGLLTKWNGRFALDGIIGVEGEDNPLSTWNSGTISRMTNHDDLQ